MRIKSTYMDEQDGNQTAVVSNRKRLAGDEGNFDS
jgi:hypothetical protein